MYKINNKKGKEKCDVKCKILFDFLHAMVKETTEQTEDRPHQLQYMTLE